ncbi:MAG: M36 family metallopeptidase [Chloroflexi bacterium]|nr:M36 family metallopeptidase [Chloroflexota bacterium]
MNSFKRFTMMASLLTGLLVTLLVSYGSSATPAVSASGPIDPLQITHNYFDQNRTEYGWVDADLSDYLVTDMYQSSETGVTHVYLRQRVNGIEVWNGTANANVMPDGSMLLAFSSFAANVDRSLYDGQPTLTAAEALNAAAQELNWPITEYFVAEQNLGGVNQAQVLSTGGISASPIPAKLVYTSDKQGQLILAWEAIVEMKYSSDWWQMTMDATTGKVLEQHNWTVSHNPADIALSDARIPFFATASGQQIAASAPSGGVADGSSYRVYSVPTESPSHSTPATPADGRVLVNQPAHALASPFGWHDTNGAAGAELTTTQGNNVHAYTDTNADNSPDAGSSPDGGAGLDFDFALDLTQAPSTYVPASVTNLFYWNNVTHDILYVHGFDEVSGNFQENNYGNGGLGSDYVNAEGQDGIGSNNANFATPTDGQNPRMQMFNWTAPTPDRDGDFDAGIIAHEYGHGWSNRLTGGPANVGCLSNSEQMGEGWSDYLSIVFTARPGDTGTTNRGVGTYALNQPTNGPGIRAFPYNTDLGVDPRTYADTISAAVPHGVGSIWTAMLWEVYWNLVDQHGFNPDIYGDWNTGGNNLALRLVSDGLKLQPCFPGFVDGRDAILAADVALTGGVNQCLIWEGFAKRGLGFSASQGSSASNADNTEAFDMPNACMTLDVTPSSQDICQGSEAAYVVNVGTSFTAPVNMSAVGNPAPSTAVFNPNPVVTLPATTTLTIANTAAVTPGNYLITITGDDTSITDTFDVDLNVFASAPTAPTLTTPANNSTGASLNPSLTWLAVATATEYDIEIATDAGFSNIVYTATEATNGHNVATSLNANTQYFWRVTSVNPCGTGATSTAFSFTTVNLLCRQPNLAITDNATVTDTFVVGDTGEIADLDVIILANHTFVGDTIFTLVHQETATSVTMIDRPGRTTTGFGCGGNDIDVSLDDEGADGPVENQCANAPALFGSPTPNNPLSAFDGEDLSGTWELQVSDAAGGDTGTLLEWCLAPSLVVTDYVVEVGAAVTAQNGDANTSVSYTVDITNTGVLSDSYNLAAVSSEGWNTSIDPASVTLNAGQSASVEVTVDIPANVVDGTVDTTTFTATSQGNGSVSDSVDLATAVNDPEIAITPTELEATVTADSTADQTLTIWNMGGSNLTWAISEIPAQTMLGACPIGDIPWLSVNPTSGTVLAGGSEDVTATYDATGYSAGVYTGTLCIASNDTVTPQLTVPVTMTVSEAGVDVGPNAALSGMPGETVTYNVAITNTGSITDTYDLSIAGNGWTTNHPASITLMAGEASSFDVTVEVPAGAWAGDWDAVTVMATSQTDNSISDWAELTTTAEAVYGFDWSADTTGHTGAAGATVTYTISLTNTGNTTDTFTVALAGHSWTTTSSHSSMMLAPGESADFTVSVVIDAGAAHPDTDTTTLTVTSDADGSVTNDLALTTAVEEIIVPANPVIYLPMIMRP